MSKPWEYRLYLVFYNVLFCFVLVNNKINLICTHLTSRDSCAEVNDVIFLEEQLFLEARYLLNYPIKMPRVSAKIFLKIFSSDFFFHTINNNVDCIALKK